MNKFEVKSTEGITKLLNDKHDLLNIGDISIQNATKIIDDNVTLFHKHHPLFHLDIPKQPLERYRLVEKFKVLLMVMTFICDEERVQLNEYSYTSLNTARVVTQKFTYSLMGKYNDLTKHEYTSILWFVSLGKTLIDTLSFRFDGVMTISDKILKSFGPSLLNLWKKWSNIIKNPQKNGYLKNGEYRFDVIFQEIRNEFEIIPRRVIENMLNLISDKKIHKILTNLLKFIYILDVVNHNEITLMPKLKLVTGYDDFEFVMMKEFSQFERLSFATGYNNPIFLRAFIPMIKTATPEEKRELANYSHQDLYNNVSMLKYQKNRKWTINNPDSNSNEIINSFKNKIHQYFDKKFN